MNQRWNSLCRIYSHLTTHCTPETCTRNNANISARLEPGHTDVGNDCNCARVPGGQGLRHPPSVPRPQDEVPREKRLSGMFNQARSMGQTWDTLSPISPVHACSLRSARHPDPSAPRAPSSSALLYFFLYIHGSYHLLNMPLFQKYTVYY